MDADRPFGYMLDTDKDSVIQNGVVMTTRREALEQVRSNLRGITRTSPRLAADREGGQTLKCRIRRHGPGE